MNFWKIRHKPSGLFFKPSKHRAKHNLSKDGKTYSKKPTLKNVGSGYVHPDDYKAWKAGTLKSNGRYEPTRPYIASEWEIVRYRVVEDGIE